MPRVPGAAMRLSQRTARWVVAVLSCLFVAGWCGCGGPDAELKEASDEGLPPEAVAVRQAFESAPPADASIAQRILRHVPGMF